MNNQRHVSGLLISEDISASCSKTFGMDVRSPIWPNEGYLWGRLWHECYELKSLPSTDIMSVLWGRRLKNSSTFQLSPPSANSKRIKRERGNMRKRKQKEKKKKFLTASRVLKFTSYLRASRVFPWCSPYDTTIISRANHSFSHMVGRRLFSNTVKRNSWSA